jgi:hypothetical protein
MANKRNTKKKSSGRCAQKKKNLHNQTTNNKGIKIRYE